MTLVNFLFIWAFFLWTTTLFCDTKSLGSRLLEEKLFKSDNISETRVYFLKRVNGPGCPYTASWLIHINLYRKITWYLDITKMEAATFHVYDKAKFKFQVSDPDSYFVHHMSMFEHVLHKRYGFDVAKNRTLEMSKAAYAGECNNLTAGLENNYLALIPFYGGLPPNVTKDLSVKSIGQGNSLVDAGTKALQAFATLCSCLKYFGRAVIGVARIPDRERVLRMISRLSEDLQQRINVVQFEMHKPSHLPFHLLAWGQSYSYHYNCYQFYDNSLASTDESKGFALGTVISSKVIDQEEYHICGEKTYPPPRGTPIRVSFLWKNDSSKHIFTPIQNSSTPFIPLRYIYYTECDQIVKFDDMVTFTALSAATNESTFFTGRRREKNRDSDPSHYMGELSNWRECGSTGYSITWPKSKYVYHEK